MEALFLLLPSLIFILPVSYVADVLSASTASYGLEGKRMAMMHASVDRCFPCALILQWLAGSSFDFSCTLTLTDLVQIITFDSWKLKGPNLNIVMCNFRFDMKSLAAAVYHCRVSTEETLMCTSDLHCRWITQPPSAASWIQRRSNERTHNPHPHFTVHPN